MHPPMLRAIFCGTSLVVLAATSIVLQSQVRVPLAWEDDFLFITGPDRLVWYDQHRFDPGRSPLATYDLDTDQLRIRTLAQVPIDDYRLANGNYIRPMPSRTNGQAIRIMDGQTLEMIREVELPPCFTGDLLNQRYLVAVEAGTLLVCDLLSPDPEQLRSLPLRWKPAIKTDLKSIRDSNLVVAVAENPLSAVQAMPKPPPPTFDVCVYRIDEDSIKPVASWMMGHSEKTILRHGNMLLSLSPDCLTLEGRDLDTLELVQSSPLPQTIVDRLPSCQFEQDLCEVHDSQTKRRTVYRLDTLTELHDAQALTVDYWNSQLEANNSRYRILRGWDAEFRKARLVIYDMDLDQVAMDRQYDNNPAAMILDGDRLAVCEMRTGITAEIYDIKTGQLQKTIQPFAWLLPWYTLWSVAAAVAAIAWIYYSARAKLSLLTSILLMAATFVPIQVYPLTQYGSVINPGRPATAYSLAILLSASAGLVWIGFSGIQNRIMRWTYQLSVLSMIAIAMATLEGHNSFREQSTLTSALFMAATAAYAALLSWLVWRLLGYRVEWSGRRDEGKSNSSLLQFFALNAASAALLIACYPFRFMNWNLPQAMSPLALTSVLNAIPYLFVFALFKTSDRWFARWILFAFVVAVVLVLDFNIAFLRPHLFFIGRIEGVYLRVILAGFMITFLWLWAFRLRGCRLIRHGAPSSTSACDQVGPIAQR